MVTFEQAQWTPHNDPAPLGSHQQHVAAWWCNHLPSGCHAPRGPAATHRHTRPCQALKCYRARLGLEPLTRNCTREVWCVVGRPATWGGVFRHLFRHCNMLIPCRHGLTAWQPVKHDVTSGGTRNRGLRARLPCPCINMPSYCCMVGIGIASDVPATSPPWTL